MIEKSSSPDRLLRSILSLEESGGTLTIVRDEARFSMSHKRLFALASECAAGLRHHGVGPGDMVLIGGRTDLDLIVTLLGCWLRGAAVGMVPHFASRFSGRLVYEPGPLKSLLALRPNLCVTTDISISSSVVDLASLAVLSPHALMTGRRRSEVEHVSEDEIAIIQLSSGTTGSPHPIGVPRQALVSSIEGMANKLALNPEIDSFVGWLPMYHDMGLVGLFCLPTLNAVSATIIDTTSYIEQPLLWFEELERSRGSVTIAPQFGYSTAARLLYGRASNYNFEHLRLAINGAEPVIADQFEAFLQAVERGGAPEHCGYPVYGLAEATLAVTMPDTRRPIYSTHLNAQSDAEAKVPIRSVLLGTALTSLQLGIRNDADAELPNGEVGEVVVRGAPASTRDLRGGRHESTLNCDASGWLHTGDLGATIDNELVIVGRKKDLIVIAGRNVYPELVEQAVRRVMPGIRRLAAVGIAASGSTESLHLVVERPRDAVHKETLANIVRDDFGFSCRVHLVPPNTLPKTSSGKIARHTVKSDLARELGAL